MTWRYTDDYCGWAPLPPHTVYREGVGIFYNGVAVSANFDFGLGVNFFTFVPTRNFCDPHPRRFRAESSRVAQFYNHTTIINDFHVDSRSHAIVNGGIPPQRISAVTRTEIRPVSIRETSAPVSRGEQLGRDGQTLDVNRPHFDAGSVSSLNNGIRPRPVQVPRQNTQRSLIINGNGNNSNPHPQAPAQNNISQPNRNWNTPQTPACEPDRKFSAASRSALMFQRQSKGSRPIIIRRPRKRRIPVTIPTSGFIRQNSSRSFRRSANHYSPPTTPPAAPVERQQNNEPRQNYSPPAPQPAAPVEHQQNNNESRQNSSPPASSGSQQSNQQGWNQNKPGH